MPNTRMELSRCALALLLLGGCSYELGRFNVAGDAEDVADGGNGGTAGDGDLPGDGDGDLPGDGDGDTPGDGDGDGDDLTAECTGDDGCAPGFVCDGESCAFAPPGRQHSATLQTAGGGLMTGGGRRLQLRLGAPTPMGRMRGGGRTLLIGPLSGTSQ